MKSVVLIVVLWMCLCIPCIWSQQKDTLAPKSTPSISFELATMAFYSNGSINFEIPLHDQIRIRAGCGIGYMFGWDDPGSVSVGLLSTVNFLTAGPRHRFELDVGVSINRESTTWEFSDLIGGRHGTVKRFLPSISFGYRYQPAPEGIVLRTGICYTFIFGFPVFFSVGYAF